MQCTISKWSVSSLDLSRGWGAWTQGPASRSGVAGCALCGGSNVKHPRQSTPTGPPPVTALLFSLIRLHYSPLTAVKRYCIRYVHRRNTQHLSPYTLHLQLPHIQSQYRAVRANMEQSESNESANKTRLKAQRPSNQVAAPANRTAGQA